VVRGYRLCIAFYDRVAMVCRSKSRKSDNGADGMPEADVCRKAGISQATYFNWKRKYDGLLPTEMRRLK
jgi:hypothetical protein